MHSKTFIAVFALATAAIAAPLPSTGDLWGATPVKESPAEVGESLLSTPFVKGAKVARGSSEDPITEILNAVGSPLENGNSDGSGDSAGNGNDQNGDGNGVGDGNSNGDGNTFGDGNSIGSGDSGISIVRRGDSSSDSDWLGQTVGELVGSPSGNGNGDGSSNSAGDGNEGNGNSNGGSDGNSNGDGNVFGDSNNIGSGDSGISIGRRTGESSSSLTETIDELVGSPSGNGLGDGLGDSAGNSNSGNGLSNGNSDGDGNGDSNTFGDGNSVGSSDDGIKIGRKVRKSPETPGTYVGNIVDAAVVPLESGSSDSLLASPSDDGSDDGSTSSAGSGNSNNGNNNGSNDGDNNGSNNAFGNNNEVLSNDAGISIPITVRSLPPDSGALIPEQTVDELDEDVSDLTTVFPGSIQKVAEGAVTGVDNQKRQVLTGLEDAITEDILAYIP